MKKLTAADFEQRGGYGQERWEADRRGWLIVTGAEGRFSAEAHSLDWWGDDGETCAATRDDFATVEEALSWAADRINEIPLRQACEALEAEFEVMAEWLPRVLPFVAAARAEAALAERAACAEMLDAEIAALKALGYERDESGMSVVGWRIKSVRAALDAIRARTTPATLSTDTLAAIAEARGLRLVEPERLAELEALRVAVDEETALDRERSEHGCGDASCVVERATGMTTNGGCRCGRRALRAALQRARKELEALRGGKDGAK